MSRDTNTICKSDNKYTQGLLGLIVFGIITFGVYIFVWFYKLGNRLRDNARKYGLLIKDGGETLLIWFLICPLFCGMLNYMTLISKADGFWIIIAYLISWTSSYIGWHVIIKNINALADEYNKKLSPVTTINNQGVALVDNQIREQLPNRPIINEQTAPLRKGVDEKYCTTCGDLIRTNNTFCPHCGARQN